MYSKKPAFVPRIDPSPTARGPSNCPSHTTIANADSSAVGLESSVSSHKLSLHFSSLCVVDQGAFPLASVLSKAEWQSPLYMDKNHKESSSFHEHMCSESYSFHEHMCSSWGAQSTGGDHPRTDQKEAVGGTRTPGNGEQPKGPSAL